MDNNEKNMQELNLDELDGVVGGMSGEAGATSGFFMSSTGTQLNLIVNWSILAGPGGQRMLNVAVSTYSYAIGLDAMPGGVELNINGAVYVSGANAVDYRGEEMTANLLAVFSVPIFAGPQIINVIWHFQGNYGGTELGDITAAGVIAG